MVSLEFFIDIKSFRSHYGPGVDSASNRNEYQEYFLEGKEARCVRLTTLPTSCAVVMNLRTLTSWNPLGHSRPVTDWFAFHLLTPCSTVLLQKLTGFRLVKELPTFYGTRRFITAFTNARHLSLSWAGSIEYIPPHPTFWRFSLTLSSHLRLGLPFGLFPS